MDTNKKVQPATLPRSAHAFECSLRHPLGKICNCGLGDTAKPAPAPLPGDDGEICARLLSACTGHPHALIPWPHRLLHDAVAHISDLTRRLAEAEAERDEQKKRRDADQELFHGATAMYERELSAAIGTDRFLDLPDGGDVGLFEQVARMRKAFEAAEARVRELKAENHNLRVRAALNPS